MTQQLILPDFPMAPSWVTLLLPRYLGQRKHFARAKIVKKDHQPRKRVATSIGFPPRPAAVVIDPVWSVTVKTPHGKCVVEIKEHVYELIREGDVLPVSYQLSRRFNKTQGIRAKLIS